MVPFQHSCHCWMNYMTDLCNTDLMNSAESCSLILTNNLRTVCDIFYTHASKSLISFPTPIVTEKRTRMFLREAGGDKWQWCHGHKNYHDEPWLLNKTQELPAHSDGSVNRFFSSKKGLDLNKDEPKWKIWKRFWGFRKIWLPKLSGLSIEKHMRMTSVSG